jgi:hypothetical protein
MCKTKGKKAHKCETCDKEFDPSVKRDIHQSAVATTATCDVLLAVAGMDRPNWIQHLNEEGTS